MHVRKLLVVGFAAATFFISPSVTQAATLAELEAQVVELTAQLAVLQDSTSCVGLSNNLSVGSTDATTNGDVSRLQAFLGGEVTGYFGVATEALVQKWQKENDIVSSGTADTTGYGAVGPRARGAMNKKCLVPVATLESTSKPTTTSTTASTTASTSATLPPVKVKVGVGEINYMDGGIKLSGTAQGVTKFAIYMKKKGDVKIFGSKGEEVKVDPKGKWFYEFEIPAESGTYTAYVTKGGKILHEETFTISKSLLKELLGD